MEFVKLGLATYEAVQLTPCPIPCTIRIKSVYSSGSEEATLELRLSVWMVDPPKMGLSDDGMVTSGP